MSRSDRLATAKAIGEDIEALVVETIDGLAAAEDPEDWYDAVAVDPIGPRQDSNLLFGSCCLITPETPVEIKACKRRVSNGHDRDRPGRWLLQVDQHRRLIEEGAVYLLVVYEETPGGKQPTRMLVVPATIIDEIVADSWYDVTRSEDQVAQLPWPHVLDDAGGADDGDA